jgi:hypothetical protein
MDIYEKASIFCLDDGHLFSAHHAYRLQETVKVYEVYRHAHVDVGVIQ